MAAPVAREPELLGQTVVVIGGSAGIGLETARRARKAPTSSWPGATPNGWKVRRPRSAPRARRPSTPPTGRRWRRSSGTSPSLSTTSW
ncbi:hypothetical protein ACFQZC_35820 [Streptacidiphilus monticola]